jgi:hypothetical protein
MNICRFDRTRAYIKIEDGCESRCTYCIIPKARGKIRSKSPSDVLDEVNTLIAGGCREIVLTGIETASYGKDIEGCDFAELLTLVYNERQREFVAEGKRWYDLVRQAEYDNSTENVLSTYMSATTIVKNRLKKLLSFYNPVYAEEMKIAGVENGGALVQNPVWERYSK